MKTARLNTLVERGVIVLFLALGGAFLLDVWGKIHPLEPLPTPPISYTNTTTVRLSARQMVEMEEDTSGMDCYACHDRGKVGGLRFGPQGTVILPPAHKDLIFARMNCLGCHDEEEGVELEYNDDGDVIIPPAHQGTILQHGQSSRNNDCYNCHVSTNLVMLRTVNGQLLKLTESNDLCANCHGPTHRNWMIGVHGRFNGFWNTQLGERERVDCTSCHDPHSSHFANMIPRPAPKPYHNIRAQAGSSSPPEEAMSEAEAAESSTTETEDGRHE